MKIYIWGDYMIRINLSKQLETAIFDELRGKYDPKRDEARFNADSDAEKVSTYLGTYFPRSWAEHKLIWESLLQNQLIKTAFREKEVINIIDIGSGTGGHLFAVVELLRKELKWTRLNIIAVDANKTALQKQEELHECLIYNGVEINFVPYYFDLNANAFAEQLLTLCQKINGNIDIMITSKFLSELSGYAAKANSDPRGFFRAFLTVADKVLPAMALRQLLM